MAVRQLKRYVSWVQNVVRQFGPYLLWAEDICEELSLVREDRDGRTDGVPVVTPVASLGSYVRKRETLKASKREAPPKMRLPWGQPPEGPFETRTSIGHRCKRRKVLSQVILIAREAFQHASTHPFANQSKFHFAKSSKLAPASAPSQCSVVALARRPHLFPSRTQQLSFSAPMVLGP